MFLRRVLIGLFFLISTGRAIGQILDDTSRLVYGPETVGVVFESDLLYNTDTTHLLDTALYGLENFTLVDRERHFYQDLGNYGSAVFPIFYPLRNSIGRYSGYTAFDPYVTTPEEFTYYDTKSPYIKTFAIIGGQGRSIAAVDYTQNINPNWNIGFQISRLTADKQIGLRTRDDRNVVSTNITLHNYYEHPEIPYKMMAHINYYSIDVDETGGVFYPDTAAREEKFQYQDAIIRLEDAVSQDTRFNLHLYHEYALFKQFQVYHRLDRNTHTNRYTDFSGSGSELYDAFADYYNNIYFDRDSTYHQSDFTEFSNEVGLKGSLGSVYYRVYAKNRIVDHEYLYSNPFGTNIENYIGGESHFNWKDKFRVRVQAELMQSGEYLLEGSLESNLLEASYKSVRYRQSFISRSLFMNHYDYDNSYDPGFSNELKGKINLSRGNLEVRPFASFTTHNNLVYFDTEKLPQQASGPAIISRFGGNINYTLWTNREKKEGFKFENEFYYTNVSGGSADVVRIPEFFYNGKVFWDGKWFDDALPTQVGINLHAKTSYFVNGFDPVTQQFHIQNEESTRDYLTADLFLNMKIERLYVFVKGTYANQPGNDGYFITYLYPGQARVVDFGVKWLFFD